MTSRAEPWFVRATNVAIVALGVAAVLPLWIVTRPPLQDWPFHLAALRVIHDFDAPSFGFRSFYALRLAAAGSPLYWLLGDALAHLFGVDSAHRLLASFYPMGTIFGLVRILDALGRPRWLALFAFVVLYGLCFMFGFMPNLFGTPWMLFGSALAVENARSFSRARVALLAAIVVACFFVHLVPFVALGVVCACLFPWAKPRTWAAHAAPGLAVVACVLGSLARSTHRSIVDGATFPALGDRTPFAFSSEVEAWLACGLADGSSRALFRLALAVALFMAVLAVREHRRDARSALLDDTQRRFARAPLACLFLYFILGNRVGAAIAVGPRFLVLAALLAIPLIPIPPSFTLRARAIAAALLTALASASIATTCLAFMRFEHDEVGAFDEALGAIPPGKKVAGLIFEPRSRVVTVDPFLHFVSYYQVAKGGYVQFSFSSLSYWPFEELADARPPAWPLRPHWELHPERVTVDELSPFYDYVLVEGRGFAPSDDLFRPVFERPPWSVWKRVTTEKPNDTRP